VVRALVTGGAGFIGSHIAEALIRRGDEVAVLDDLSRGRRSQVPAEARLIEADINDELAPVMEGSRPEIVFHEAAQVDVRRSVAEPLFDARTNVLGTVNLLEACARSGVRRFIFASSGGAIYGDTDSVPTAEDHPLRPASHYGAAKAAGELYARVYADLGGLEVVSLRYANVYGPRQDPHGEAGVVAIFTERLLRGAVPVINGEGTQTRDYVFVGDVVAANLAAIDAPVGTYNVGTGVETDVNRLFALLAAIVGSEAGATHGPAKRGEQMRSCLDPSHSAAQLGWHPAMALEEGLEATVRSFREAAADLAGDGVSGPGEPPARA
jgi:UDP-glucose 4-epimerase